MFDSLSEKLQAVFKNLRGYGKLTEKNVADALREVRLALLEADVNYKVVKDFVERTKQRALGQEVLSSVTPGQQIVKIVHDELVVLMGGGETQPCSPTTIQFPVLFGGRAAWLRQDDDLWKAGEAAGKARTEAVARGVRRVPTGSDRSVGDARQAIADSGVLDAR